KQVYPRLNYVPAFIQTPQDKERVLYHSVLHACIWATGVAVAFLFFLGLRRGQCSASVCSFFLTIAVLLFLVVLCYEASRSFHLLGTGQIGQDVFYFSLKSVRTGLIIGLLTTLFMLP